MTQFKAALQKFMVLGARMAANGRLGEVANGRFGEFQFAEPGLADWLLSGNRYFRFGSRRDRPLFELIAEKQSVKFRSPQAAIRHRVHTTHCSR
jgi:hypothetical protein